MYCRDCGRELPPSGICVCKTQKIDPAQSEAASMQAAAQAGSEMIQPVIEVPEMADQTAADPGMNDQTAVLPEMSGQMAQAPEEPDTYPEWTEDAPEWNGEFAPGAAAQAGDYQGGYQDNGYQNNAYQGGYQDNGYQDNAYQANEYQSGYQNDGYQDNGYQNNAYQGGYQDNGYQDNGYQGGYQDNGYQGSYQDNGYQGGYQDNGYQGSYQDNGYQDNGYQDNGYQNNAYQGGYQDNGYQNNAYQGGYQNNGYQNNGYQNNGYQNNGYQPGGYQDPYQNPYNYQQPHPQAAHYQQQYGGADLISGIRAAAGGPAVWILAVLLTVLSASRMIGMFKYGFMLYWQIGYALPLVPILLITIGLFWQAGAKGSRGALTMINTGVILQLVLFLLNAAYLLYTLIWVMSSGVLHSAVGFTGDRSVVPLLAIIGIVGLITVILMILYYAQLIGVGSSMKKRLNGQPKNVKAPVFVIVMLILSMVLIAVSGLYVYSKGMDGNAFLGASIVSGVNRLGWAGNYPLIQIMSGYITGSAAEYSILTFWGALILQELIALFSVIVLAGCNKARLFR